MLSRRFSHEAGKLKGFAAKFALKYSGPYTVVRVVSPIVYDLRESTGPTYQRFHVRDLKPTRLLISDDDIVTDAETNKGGCKSPPR